MNYKHFYALPPLSIKLVGPISMEIFVHIDSDALSFIEIVFSFHQIKIMVADIFIVSSK